MRSLLFSQTVPQLLCFVVRALYCWKIVSEMNKTDYQDIPLQMVAANKADIFLPSISSESWGFLIFYFHLQVSNVLCVANLFKLMTSNVILLCVWRNHEWATMVSATESVVYGVSQSLDSLIIICHIFVVCLQLLLIHYEVLSVCVCAQ